VPNSTIHYMVFFLFLCVIICICMFVYSALGLSFLNKLSWVELSWVDIGYGHVVQHHQRTSSQQFYNLLYKNSPPTDKHLPHPMQHLDMSRCWTLALRCGKICCTTSCRIAVSLSGVRVVEFGTNAAITVRSNLWLKHSAVIKSQTPLQGHRLRTPATNTTNGQAHNSSTTNLPHRNARAQHLDMSRCWDVVFVQLRCWCS